MIASAIGSIRLVKYTAPSSGRADTEATHDELGAGHPVLMVRTNRGEFVLDNKTEAILPWSQTPYTYVKREGDADSHWVSLGGRTSPVATANR
jgi:hypothetical protein